MKYDFQAIEKKWQARWEEEKPFAAVTGDPRPKFYGLIEFPYPSGQGLHVGHPRPFTAMDIICRKRRMQGYNVLFPIGFDAFGLPTENYAIKNHIHPAVVTKNNIANFTKQLKMLGYSFDWDRAVDTTDPSYYKWTQWIFLQMYKHGLAYKTTMPVNWCTSCKCVLANEEVVNGVCERCGSEVVRKEKSQWMLAITKYAQRLIDDLDDVDYIERVKTQQRNWIGRSTGAEITFKTNVGDDITVYTTRADTLFGTTYMVISPEHPLLKQWQPHIANWDAVAAYQEEAAHKSDFERGELNKAKTGVRLDGIEVMNPVTPKAMPMFVSDYVLMGYGTGVVMGVPGHDQRDWEFARAFNLDIVQTIGPAKDPRGINLDEKAYVGDGVAVDSANAEVSLDGLGKDAAKAKMIAWLEEKGYGRGAITYRLRDWLFSRQRYWGEPFPIVWDEDGVAHALPEDMLPVELPEVSDYSPRTFDPDDADSSPEAPLGRAEEWVNVTLDLGDGPKRYRRETNTMPQWAGSCWYEMRYTDPTNSERFAGEENLAYWMGPREGKVSGGTDMYVGGVEHAVLHLLYARFWQKVLFDLGHVPDAEPYHTLFNQGYVQAYAYTDERGQYVPADEVEGDETTGFTYKGEPVGREYGKMGKSLKNIVTPDEMYDAYGADVFRVYEMSMGPLDLSRPWETRAVVGSQRFLQRLWRNAIDEETGELTVTEEAADDKTRRLVARTIAEVTEEYENLRINTAISKLIVLNNHLTSLDAVPRDAIEALILMLAPVAPHLCEELWARLGHEASLAREPFPVVEDSSLLVEDTVTAIVQVNGKVKARIEVAPSISEEDLIAAALEQAPIVKALDGSDPLKVIARAPKLVNVVVKK